MAPKVEVGKRIRPRLPERYRDRLTNRQVNFANAVIRSLVRTCEDGCCASGEFNGKTVEVQRGAITVQGDRRRSLLGATAGVGEVVYEAVAAGVRFPSRGDGEYRRGEHEGRGGDGESESESRESESESRESEGSDGDGDGDGDGNTESESESDGDGESDDDGESESESESSESRSNNRALNLLEKLWALRDFLTSGVSDVQDIISTRCIAQSARLHYLGGFSDEYILFNATLNWTDTAKARCGVPVSLDQAEAGRNRRASRPLPNVAGIRHALFDTVQGHVMSGVMTALIGPAGSGKGVLAAQTAEALGLPFAYLAVNEGASVAWLFGRNTPHPERPYVDTRFLRIWANGGVFLFDELDAADPNMLLSINEALSNGVLENPMTGESITRSADTVLMASANTYMMGADAMYQARNALDGSTTDRVRMGRLIVDYDRDVERSIMGVA